MNLSSQGGSGADGRGEGLDMTSLSTRIRETISIKPLKQSKTHR